MTQWIASYDDGTAVEGRYKLGYFSSLWRRTGNRHDLDSIVCGLHLYDFPRWWLPSSVYSSHRTPRSTTPMSTGPSTPPCLVTRRWTGPTSPIHSVANCWACSRMTSASRPIPTGTTAWARPTSATWTPGRSRRHPPMPMEWPTVRSSLTASTVGQPKQSASGACCPVRRRYRRIMPNTANAFYVGFLFVIDHFSPLCIISHKLENGSEKTWLRWMSEPKKESTR